ASAPSFREEIEAYARSIGISPGNVHFAEDEGKAVPKPLETEGEIYRDDWKATVSASDLPPQKSSNAPSRNP
ncbi:MAG: hypothetical protein K8R69_06390, partial [Deltaproteobacteria bacterium]|nr:hypothetical protein [Deltaproteobacteria bacterium]